MFSHVTGAESNVGKNRISKLSCHSATFAMQAKKELASDGRLTRIYLVHVMSNLTPYCHQLHINDISMGQNLRIALSCFLVNGIIE